MKLYLAYGANTNMEQMALRCPDARYICNLTIRHHRLVFRGVADVTRQRDAKVVCAVWLISPRDEEALDRFEGYPNMYVKRYLTLHLNGRRHRAMLYVMRSRSYETEPSRGYEACLRQGYTDCGMPLAQIDKAIRHATEWRSRNNAQQLNLSRQWAEDSIPPLDAELDQDAADQFMMEWYNNNREESANG